MGIECDVQKTADGQAVVFHDFDLDRLTSETGPVANRSAEQLARITLREGGDLIPTLRQLLDQVAGQVPLLIEVKTRKERPVSQICLAVRRVLEGYVGPHAVMSFDPRVCSWFARHSARTARGLVVTEENDKALLGRIRRHLWLWIAKPHFLAYDIRDLPSRFAASQRRRGLPDGTLDRASRSCGEPCRRTDRRGRGCGVSGRELVVRIAGGIGEFDAAQWDPLDASANPFTSHAFLSSLEDSGSVGGTSGWTPAPITVASVDGQLAGALPAYLKDHSQGEYVFDHAWADAWHRAGGSYYPKLQISVPFTPATGPRVLIRDPALAPALLKAAEQVCDQNGLSSAHATFIQPDQLPVFEAAGWLLRSDIQFHWENRGYACFEDFLGALSSAKRKNLRKERAAAQQGVTIRHLTGAEITEAHWDAFWRFYQDTGARKWGRPYLTREAFSLLGQRMGDKVLLMLAEMDGMAVAGALNFIGPDAIYGRYWGAIIDKPFLHFELCYYQAIDAAIARGLSRVEAGAQGSHKLARGYEPVQTWSAHYIAHEGFRAAVADFLERERAGVADQQLWLGERTPFRKG
jgi:predicted N-acyltransferase